MAETRFHGIVIGHEDWGDVARLISFYTPEYGKIEGVARGVRWEKSKLKGHLTLGAHGEFAIAKNHGRGVVIDAVSFGTFDDAFARAETAHAARAVCALYDAYLYSGAPDPALWEALVAVLAELREAGRSEDDPALAISAFAEAFLTGLGYRAAHEARGVHDARTHDAALAHTELSGPTFSAILRDLGALAPAH